MPKIKSKYRRSGTKKRSQVSPAVKKYIQRSIERNIEHKQTAITYASLNVSSTSGSRYLLNAPDTTVASLVQGVDWDERLGAEYLVKKIDFRGVVRITNCTTSRFETVRVLLMTEKQPEGVAFAGAELLATNASGASVLSAFNEKHRHRFIIHSDKTYNLNDFSGAAGVGMKKNIKLIKTFKKPMRTVLYNDQGAAKTGVAALEKTAIYVVMFCSANVTCESAVGSVVWLDA